MNRNEFIEEVKKEILCTLPEELKKDLEIQETTVMKSNDQEHHGLTFKRGESEAAPTIYLDEAFERFSGGEDMHALAREIKNAYVDTIGMPEPQKVDFDFDKIRDNLTVRLLEIRRNREFLSQTPYMTVGHGLAMVCDIKMSDGREGSWRATVTQSMLESQGYDKQELFVTAMENARVIDPPILVDMNQALFTHDAENLMLRDVPLEAHEDAKMYVLSNESGMLGSAALFYPEAKEHIASVIGEGYSVIPSSVHEVLIIPDSAGIDANELSRMVKEANRSVVEAKDVLSDNVLHYDRERGQLEPAADQRQTQEQQLEKGA